MKKLLRLRHPLAALAAAGLLLQCSPAHAQTAPPSPVGTWDIVIGGSQSGLAILTFNSDFSLLGTEILRPITKKTSTSQPDPRYPGGPPERIPLISGTGNSDISSSSSTTVTNFLGSATLGGLWTHDSNGKVIGLLDQISQVVVPVEVVTTNVVDGTVFFTTNIVLVLQLQTNAVSFRASVAPGKRITICSFGPEGNNVLRGVPTAPVTDMSGSFYGTGKRSSLPFVELLGLAPDVVFQNRYDVLGTGPGYVYNGRVIVSKQKQIALLTLTDAENPTLTVYTGAFNLTSRRGTLHGIDSNNGRLTYKLIHQ